jgi:hypothetical protein
VNTYAILVVNDHFESLVADAARRRLVGKRGPSLSDRLSSATAGLRRLVANGDGTSVAGVPTLRDYPYRS